MTGVRALSYIVEDPSVVDSLHRIESLLELLSSADTADDEADILEW